VATSVKCIRKQWHSENGPELSTVQACIPEKGSLPSITFRHLCAKCSAFSVEQWSPFHTVVLGLLKALIYCLQLKPLITKSDKGTPEVTVNLSSGNAADHGPASSKCKHQTLSGVRRFFKWKALWGPLCFRGVLCMRDA